jgi:copper chaperone NosL
MTNKLSKFGMWLMIAAAVLTVISAFIPLWRIDLQAPQYPEGLVLLIGGTSGISGDIIPINDLNHYVGMEKIFAENFWEFQALPYILCGFALLFLVSALIRSKKLTYGSFGLFVIFGILSFVDFYYWTYNYGHNLDPSAPIQVPGMAYQPPILGYKKLLNFEAFSWPDTGGYLLVGAGVLVALVVFYELGVFDKLFKKKTKTA